MQAVFCWFGSSYSNSREEWRKREKKEPEDLRRRGWRLLDRTNEEIWSPKLASPESKVFKWFKISLLSLSFSPYVTGLRIKSTFSLWSKLIPHIASAIHAQKIRGRIRTSCEEWIPPDDHFFQMSEWTSFVLAGVSSKFISLIFAFSLDWNLHSLEAKGQSPSLNMSYTKKWPSLSEHGHLFCHGGSSQCSRIHIHKSGLGRNSKW